MRGRVLAKRRVPLWLVILLLLVSTGSTAAALLINTFNEKISIYSGQVQDSDFQITALETKIKGRNRVDVSLTLKNGDSANAHSADVTVQLLDSNGDVLLEQTENTGNVEASGTWTHTFTFTQQGLVSQYDSTFIVIKQTG